VGFRGRYLRWGASKNRRMLRKNAIDSDLHNECTGLATMFCWITGTEKPSMEACLLCQHVA